MRTFTGPHTLYSFVMRQKRAGKRIGLVPTMGYLHEGHLSLIKKAHIDTDCVIVSIFVNPIQFGQGEDLAAYPRNIARDKKLAKIAGADAVFIPSAESMYPPDYSVYVTERNLSKRWCGEHRQGHFTGVCTVVLRLFSVCAPDCAYFGQKDIQQALIIQKMAIDLFLPVSVVLCPIIREHDGLAMSSRNVYLSPSERLDALVLYKALTHAVARFKEGIFSAGQLTGEMNAVIQTASSARIEYIACVDGKTLEPVETLSSGCRILLAVRIGTTRLIDNILL
ncbi:pantoate--beta-alanine ligase [bacterium]|nr:pantoate--beta-alanine ligase [bacterium]